MKTLTEQNEMRYLRGLYFLFAFSIMSWIPRFPEVKAILRLTNGEFGSLISSGAIGSLVALLTVGHIVHKFGAKIVLEISGIAIALSLVTFVHTDSVFIFFIANIIFGAAISGFHVSMTSQAFHLQDRSRKFIITHLSGIWSSGALATAILAGLLVDRVSITVHITTLAVVSLLIILFIILRMKVVLILPNSAPDNEYRVRDIFKDFKFDSLVSFGLICGIYLEFAIGDWSTIFMKEDIGIKSGLNTLPYILFIVAMIIGRLAIHKLDPYFTIDKLAKMGALLAGTSFFITICLSMYLRENHKVATLIIMAIGFTIAGLGSSFLGPTFMNAANARSSAPSSVIVGQLGFISNLLALVMRWIVAWTAQFTSLGIALLIPALMLFAVPYFSKALKNHN